MKAQLIPTEKLRVYHSTTSGINFETLLSFLKNGIRIDLAAGYGQGHGFYVWTKKDLALQHISFQREESKLAGYPIIINLEVIVNSINWDLDYEMNAKLIIAFIRGHWDLFKLIPDNAIRLDEDPLIISQCKKHSFPSKVIVFKFRNNLGTFSSRSRAVKSDSFSIQDGELLGKIFNYLQEHYPEKTEKFERSAFEKLCKKGTAIKYIGKFPLKVNSFEMLVDNKWLNEEQSLELVRKLNSNLAA